MNPALFETNFTGLDWAIVAIYLSGSIAVGVIANRYVGNLSDYLVAGRTLRIRLALASMTGTELGLVTVMYSAELGFSQQFASLYLGLLELTALFAVGVTGFLVYRLRQSSVMTIPEYYASRYSDGVRVVGASVMVISGVLNMGLFLKAGSQFLTAISGLDDGLYLKWMMTGLLLLVLFYTVLGGMVSVVITDLIQFLVLGSAMVLVSGYIVYDVGWQGFSSIVTEQSAYIDPTNATNPSGQGSGIGWLVIVQMAIVIFSAALLWPPSASRILSVHSPQVAQRLYLLSSVSLLSRRALPILWGIGAYVFFTQSDGLNAAFDAAIDEGRISTISAMPLYLAKIIPAGLLGLITAGMVAAFMSTHDSYLLCWSSVITQDIVAPIFGSISQRGRITLTRISILAIGAVLLVWGLWYEVSSNLWQYMAVTGTVYLAGAFPVVAGGLYWKRASNVGAYAALIGGLLGLTAMDPVIKALNGAGIDLNAAHLSILTFAVSSILFVVGSWLCPNGNKSVEAANPGGDT